MLPVVCDFCGSKDAHVLFEGSDMMFPQNKEIYAVQQCDQCGLWYLNPRPSTQEEILKLYPPEYDSYVNVEHRWLLKLRLLAWRGELRDLANLAGPDGRLLEVGCATGEYLAGLRDRGCKNVVGMEYNPHVAELGRGRYNLDIKAGDIFDGSFPNQTFDVVIMRNVLEHLPNPMSTLREVERILKPGGWYVCTIPNPDSLDARVYGRNWFGHEIPRHMHNYPQATLKRMLISTGFDLRQIDYPFIPNDWILGFKNVLLRMGVSRKFARLLDIDNPLALALFAPLGVLSGLTRSSGRMRVKAKKPVVAKA